MIFCCRKFYYPADAYNKSKLAQVLFTCHLQKLLLEDQLKVLTYSVHPGIVNTGIFENSNADYYPWVRKFFYKTPEEGARSIVSAAVDKKFEARGGAYISNCSEMWSHKLTKDAVECKRFFEFSCGLLGIEKFTQPVPE